ncbi:hypothetical protein BDR04DRAFT_1012402, partial [Suillus decipiens]
ISHTRSRYIYELYYKHEAITKELYNRLLKEGYILDDQMEEDKLCCLRCIQTKDMNYQGSTYPSRTESTGNLRLSNVYIVVSV